MSKAAWSGATCCRSTAMGWMTWSRDLRRRTRLGFCWAGSRPAVRGEGEGLCCCFALAPVSLHISLTVPVHTAQSAFGIALLGKIGEANQLLLCGCACPTAHLFAVPVHKAGVALGIALLDRIVTATSLSPVSPLDCSVGIALLNRVVRVTSVSRGSPLDCSVACTASCVWRMSCIRIWSCLSWLRPLIETLTGSVNMKRWVSVQSY